VSDAPLLVFALHASRSLGERIADRLGVKLAAHEERDFEWGQHKSRPLESVRGADVYVVHSLHGQAGQSTNDKLCRLIFFLAALRDADALRVTAVVPYLCYTRKDRQTKHRDPVITRYVATMFESVGLDRLVTVEVHNLAAFQNAFRCRTEHLGARRIFADFLAEACAGRDLAVVSPDYGGIKRANSYRAAIAARLGRDVSSGFVEKRRSEGIVSGETFVGDIRGRTAVLVDDMICGGTTLARAADACRRAGASGVIAVAAHGAFVPEASDVLARAPIDTIAILDHIPPDALSPALPEGQLRVLASAPLLADAISGMHQARSLAELLDP
jgi:ribose-phosphate pyrophosphokinase